MEDHDLKRSHDNRRTRYGADQLHPPNSHSGWTDQRGPVKTPVCWLLCEWPPGTTEPSKYWLSNLPIDTALTDLVRLGKLRWRIEHDYRELKDALGLDHYEGRTYPGWNHHVTLVAIAHAFLTLERRRPQLRAAA